MEEILKKLIRHYQLTKSYFFDDDNLTILLKVARFYQPKDFKTVFNSLFFLQKKC